MQTPKTWHPRGILAGIPLLLAALPACRSSPAPSRTPSTDRQVAPAAPATGSAEAARVEVTSEGFQPARVTVGASRRIVFRRTSDSTCATEVVFPTLGIEKPLPLNTDVAVDLPASSTGEIGFQCGMGMYKSKVVAR